MTRLPTPLARIDSRIPEAGRIRLGIKSGKAMTSIDTFRFTSPNEDVIRSLAALYGGTAKEWRDPKASPPDQFEVITQAKEIDVYLPANALTVWYELWAGGGVQRRCDGEVCQIPRTIPGGWEMGESPCVCMSKGVMDCRPYTRMNVIIPSIPFNGVWRLETKGWNAAKELPGMVNIIDMMSRQGKLVEARLHVQRRTQQTPAGKRNFVVPGVTIAHSAQDMLAGAATVTGVAAVTSGAPVAALEVGTPFPASSADDIIDAEIVETELDRLIDEVLQCAVSFGIDGRRLSAGVLAQVGIDQWTKAPTEEQLARVRAAAEKMRCGELKPLGFNPNGTVIWHRRVT